MQIEFELKKLLSEARLSGYSTIFAKRKLNDPIKLYKLNTYLSESLYPILQTVEVGLRNSINEAVSDYYHDPNWIFGTQVLTPSDVIIVQKRKNKLLRGYVAPPIGKVIADLNFGFWTSLLDATYEERLWRTIILKNTFPNMPREIRTRKNVSRAFSKIRHLRNRIFHYEPIWHWNDLLHQHDSIIQAISWIEPKLLQLIDIDRFMIVHSRLMQNKFQFIEDEIYV